MKKLVDVLISPSVLLELSLFELSVILAEARYFTMLSQLEYLCKSENIWPQLPVKFKTHLCSAAFYYQSQCKKIDEEAKQIEKILAPLNITWLYLKGSAYHLCAMTAFTGRMMSDVDLLVLDKDLATVEKALKDNGFVSTQISDYDEKFYRLWAHEIPPLKHIFRQVDLDVHFNILPKTINNRVNSQALFNASQPLAKSTLAKTLKQHAMLAHSAIHLFYESEYHKGLRDLFDIAIFIKKNTNNALFWHELIKLHEQIANQDTLYLALRYSQKVYQISAPDFVWQYYEQYKPNKLLLALLDHCFLTVFIDSFPKYRKFNYGFCSTVLYLRGHLKRMPIRLLIPHLTKKSLDRFKAKPASASLI